MSHGGIVRPRENPDNAGEGRVRWVGSGVMRTSCRVLLCAALAGSLGGCSGLGMIEPPPRSSASRPRRSRSNKSLVMVATTVKWAGDGRSLAGAARAPARARRTGSSARRAACAISRRPMRCSSTATRWFTSASPLKSTTAGARPMRRWRRYGRAPVGSRRRTPLSAQRRRASAGRRTNRDITQNQKHKGGITMTDQDTAHPFDRRLFLAGTGALALLGDGRRRARAAGRRQGGRLGPAAAADARRLRRRFRSQAGAAGGDRARARRLHRHHRRLGRRQPRGGRRTSSPRW